MADLAVIPSPAARRVRLTPVELRLPVLAMVERELRQAQRDEQRRGAYTPSLSLALDWLGVIDKWETAA